MIDDAGTRRIHLPSGVEFWLHKSGDNLTVTGNDNSGHGAVMCSWGLYISFRSYLNVCPGEDSANLANDLNNAIDRMNDFIVENSIQPTTKAAVEADVERRFQTDLDKMKNLSPDQIGKVCGPRGWGYAITERLKAMSHEERVSEIDKLLSVKRPAVMNPCL